MCTVSARGHCQRPLPTPILCTLTRPTATMSTQARGLNNFISDLRNSKSKLEESNRVEVELAKIRKKFNPGDAKLAADGSNPSLSSYQRKKYVWKLVYIHVLGYDVDFGHAEVLALVRSKK